jgi:hypothetical protein
MTEPMKPSETQAENMWAFIRECVEEARSDYQGYHLSNKPGEPDLSRYDDALAFLANREAHTRPLIREGDPEWLVDALKHPPASDIPLCIRSRPLGPTPRQSGLRPATDTAGDALREALLIGLDHLDWINAQVENAMATSAAAATANGDSDGSLQMLNSIASDIGINAMMLRDKLSAALSQPSPDDPINQIACDIVAGRTESQRYD